jgi:hypothetical protein
MQQGSCHRPALKPGRERPDKGGIHLFFCAKQGISRRAPNPAALFSAPALGAQVFKSPDPR